MVKYDAIPVNYPLFYDAFTNYFNKYYAVYYINTLLSPSYVTYGILSAYIKVRSDAFKCPNGANKTDSLAVLTASHPAILFI